MNPKRYEDTHQWIKFSHHATLNPLWAKLGEAYSKCQHLSGIPLQPTLAEELAAFVMNKGALATAAIEGNTLTEEEANDILSGGKNLPPSQEYLEQEIRNVANALKDINFGSPDVEPFQLSTDWLKEQNAKVLHALPEKDDVVPGEFTTRQLVVGNIYRAAPPEDVPYLVDTMCQWLNKDFILPSQNPSIDKDQRFYLAFFGATLAHLYTAWIHPFGDGNGRTARLIEVAILAKSGVVPWVASNLLSDHYNKTRSRYYEKLDKASKEDDVDGFILYAAEGLVDQLREQIETVKHHQRRIAWESYVHEILGHENAGKTRDRQNHLVIALSQEPAGAEQKAIRYLTPFLAEAYAGMQDRAITRDLNKLTQLGLVRKEGKLWHANSAIMNAFIPLVR